jgi:bifunctional non-homologous end joining protein LigD
MKYDGYRIGCRIEGRTVTLISRNGKDWTDAFPEICEAARTLGVREALIDGEIAILRSDGRTSFQDLQNSFDGGSRRGLTYFAFDLLYAGGESFARLPLERRKEELLRLVGKAHARSRIRYSEHVAGHGAEVFREACRVGLEGIVSKRAGSEYKPGRNDAWVKTKCVLRQEFVVGGFTDPEGSRQGIGALLTGYYDDGGRLVFAGKVGTGFTAASGRELRNHLNKLEQPDCPFTPRPAGWLGTHAHWVRPVLVCEVAFSEWTGDGRIRHPSFQGLRRDKAPAEVRREQAADAPAIPAPVRSPAEALQSHTGNRVRVPRRGERVSVAGVSISHPDRLMYHDPPISKLEVAAFYERIADWILPHLAGRPLTLVRCPQGVGSPCFYMKHSKVWAPPALRRVKIQEKTKVGDYLIADTLPALISLVQMDVLEIHTWNTRIDKVDRPDRIVLDIDPGVRVEWRQVIAAARLVRKLLQSVDLESFPKTTGGNGLHVVVPLARHAGWQECLEFSRALAEAMERHDPSRFTTAFAKAGREQKVLIDYLRNNRTNTSVAAFSTRARQGAPVSMTLRWQEVAPALKPAAWTILTAEKRLASLRSDPWKDYWNCRQRLTAAATAALRGL